MPAGRGRRYQAVVNTSLVLTLVGADRPGLVEAVAELVAGHGGNWLESRMARLGGQFAGIARVEVPAARESALRAALAALAERGLAIEVAVDPSSTTGPAKSGRPASIELVGHDRPGIVHQVAHVLASHGVNVEKLTTGCESAPMAGGLLFRAKIELLVPPAADLRAVRRDLEKIAADLMVDIEFGE